MGSSDTKSQKDFASLVRSTDDTQNVHFACCRWTQGIFFWKFFILRFAAAIVSVDPSPSTKGADSKIDLFSLTSYSFLRLSTDGVARIFFTTNFSYHLMLRHDQIDKMTCLYRDSNPW